MIDNLCSFNENGIYRVLVNNLLGNSKHLNIRISANKNKIITVIKAENRLIVTRLPVYPAYLKQYKGLGVIPIEPYKLNYFYFYVESAK